MQALRNQSRQNNRQKQTQEKAASQIESPRWSVTTWQIQKAQITSPGKLFTLINHENLFAVFRENGSYRHDLIPFSLSIFPKLIQSGSCPSLSVRGISKSVNPRSKKITQDEKPRFSDLIQNYPHDRLYKHRRVSPGSKPSKCFL